jgi:hypothetical protein
MPETAPNAAQICVAAELGEEARSLLLPNHASAEYLRVLIEKGRFPDAVQFLAHALPKREAVWWAWVCARRASGAEPGPKIKAALDATEKWIAQPTEENRRAAKATADTAELSTAAGCAGLAAFFTGGSMAPPDAPVVQPGPFLTAKAVAGAVVASVVCSEPEKAPEKFRAALEQGLHVAERIKLWPKEG